MKASEHLQAALEALSVSSPWRPALALQLRHLITVAKQHEAWTEPTAETETASVKTAPSSASGPRTTALGHSSQGRAIAGTQTATDEALALLDCVD